MLRTVVNITFDVLSGLVNNLCRTQTQPHRMETVIADQVNQV